MIRVLRTPTRPVSPKVGATSRRRRDLSSRSFLPFPLSASGSKGFPGAAPLPCRHHSSSPAFSSIPLHQTITIHTSTRRAPQQGKKKKNGGGERGRQPRRRWGAAPNKPHGDAAAHRPLPVHHGLRLLEGRQAPRPRSVSPEPLLLPTSNSPTLPLSPLSCPSICGVSLHLTSGGVVAIC